MSSSLPLFPPSASTVASDVDALYIFILAVSAFFAVGVSVAVAGSRSITRKHRPKSADIHGCSARADMESFSSCSRGHVVWGGSLLHSLEPPAARWKYK